LEDKKVVTKLDDIEFAFNEELPRYISTPNHMAYLKIPI